MDYIRAFLVGGAICAVVQIFMVKTKLMPGRIMVGLVVIGCVLGLFNLYEPLIEYAGCGASIPLVGFGNTLVTGVKEAVDEKGFLGLFIGGFKSAAVGCCAALVLGYIGSLIFKPKM